MHWIGSPLTIILIKSIIAEGVFKNIQKTKYGLKSDSIYVIEHTYNAHLVREKHTIKSLQFIGQTEPIVSQMQLQNLYPEQCYKVGTHYKS
jgi:hypothetical protein